MTDEIFVNPIRTGAQWDAMRRACERDAGGFHGEIAAEEIHWFHPEANAWLSRTGSGAWRGWDATTSRDVAVDEWLPWETALDETDAPFYRWFSGASTNAAFNEVDRHVLAGFGHEIAYWFEGDAWDAAANGGAGGPEREERITRRELLVRSVTAAQALVDLGLAMGDRIALNMPNIPEQIVWIEAAKRLGVIYTAVFGGFSAQTLAERIEDAGARLVITTDGAYRNGKLVAYKEAYTDPALDLASQGVERVVVAQHAGVADLPWREGRDRWAHELLAAAEEKICAAAGVADMSALAALADADLVAALWQAVAPRPVPADYPLFIMYTSGSTGKPKGVVHVHGGYVAGVAHTMKVSFDARPGHDRILVVADPGWITGQSYLITASLTARIPGVICEGGPLYPDAGRFASIIERHRVTIFKAGVTFLRTVMSDPGNISAVRRYDLSSLKVATFCAEPVSPAVQQFGMAHMTTRYINSYWATEHGGIVWTHPFGNDDQPLRADAHTYPLPWIFGDVWVAEGEPDQEGRFAWRPAAEGERGEIVITRPYPYLARTIWGDTERFGTPEWRGDIERFSATYFGRFRNRDGSPALAYLQGDFAIRYGDGSYSLHGRSDDVINVSGHRLGTEEIEGAILRDRNMHPASPVGNCIVIGAPHPLKGLVPVAFIVPAPGTSFGADDEARLSDLVRSEKGAIAVPAGYITVSAFPETRSGKYMRRFLKNLMEDEPLGDTTTLRNPECMDEIRGAVLAWRAKSGAKRSQ